MTKEWSELNLEHKSMYNQIILLDLNKTLSLHTATESLMFFGFWSESPWNQSLASLFKDNVMPFLLRSPKILFYLSF